MKKIISLLIVFVLCFSLIACGCTNDETSTANPDETEQVTTSPGDGTEDPDATEDPGEDTTENPEESEAPAA